MEQGESFFDKLDSKQAFTFGIVGGVLVLCTLGFFVFLSMYLNGGQGFQVAENSDNTNQEQQVNNNDNQQPTQPAGNNNINIAEVSEDDHIRGDEDAPITIVEYSDLECPFCQRFHDTMKRVVSEYDGEVRWVYRHFPLDSLHPNARKMAIASECAADQGQFWEFVDSAFQKQGAGFTANTASNIAQELGLNQSTFSTCLENREHSDIVKEQESDAKNAGGRGTPYSILIGPDGQKVPISGAQPFSQVESQIQQFLN